MATPNPNDPTQVILSRWRDHPFYTNALVLGVDIGLRYLGIYLRLGRQELVGETVVYSSGSSLEARRLKRHWRRNRRAQNQRIFQLRCWCQRVGLPWFSLAEWQKQMEPAFRLRLKGEERQDALSAGELVVCLRHILMRRGYDWHHYLESEGTYPWGNAAPMSVKCQNWVKANYIDDAIKQRLLNLTPMGDEAENRLRAEFAGTLSAAVEHSSQDNLLAHLRAHAERPYSHQARGKNYPREMLESHAEKILRNHAKHLPSDRFEAVIDSFKAILNYHRKDEAAQKDHWEKKTGSCPFTGEKRAPASDPDVLRFRLLEFLATRRYAVMTKKKSLLPPSLRLSSPAIIAWLLKHPEETAEQLPSSGDFRAVFEKRVCNPDEKLASLDKTLNGYFFSQLRDLLYPRPASADKRAALSATAARVWFNHATTNGKIFEPNDIKQALSTARTPGERSFYDQRREAQLAEWFHPHVEFLLGPRAYLLEGRQPPVGQVHGWLNKLLARPEVAAKLRAAGHPGKPDYVMIEVAGDIPRTAEGRLKIEKEQKIRRENRDKFIGRYEGKGLTRGDENSLLRAELWEQQGGTDINNALCPVTGIKLTGGPFAPHLEIAHIYPDSWGGPFQRDNLFLTTHEINGLMLDIPPARCAGYSEAHFAAMRWPQRKRDIFRTEWEKGGNPPDWGFDTRVAQLARQLRDATKKWLRITDENAFAARVGTVSGYFTAQCRKAWLDGYSKDRADLRNHLYDAMVLAHIPPGIGLNSAAFGGIFSTAVQRRSNGNVQFAYRPPVELGPDWQKFAQVHAEHCLVKHPKSSASKSSRYDETIYGIEKRIRQKSDGKPEQDHRLRVREAITNAGWPVNDAEKWFLAESQRSPAFAKLFPEKIWREWLTENARRKAEYEKPEPLVVPGFAAVRAITVDASKPQFFDALTLAAHGPHGAKNPAGERNIAVRLYEYSKVTAKGTTKTEVESRTVIHPRLIAQQAKWQAAGWVLPESKPLPVGAQLVATVTKSTVLLLPLDRAGEIVSSMEQAYAKVWCKPTALKSSDQVELRPVEFLADKIEIDADGAISRPGSRLFGLKLKQVYKLQNKSLLVLVRLNNLALPV